MFYANTASFMFPNSFKNYEGYSYKVKSKSYGYFLLMNVSKLN